MIFIVLLLGCFFLYGIFLYPKKRVLTWTELVTDGYAPDVLAHQAHLMLLYIWKSGFDANAVDPSGSLRTRIRKFLENEKNPSILEIASGSGYAANMFAKLVGNEVKVVVSDLQPNPEGWRKLKARWFPNMEFVDTSVDATKMEASLAKIQDKQLRETVRKASDLRMVNAAFHHFSHDLAKGILRDTVRCNSALLIGDISPTTGSVLYLALGTFWASFKGFVKDRIVPPLVLVPIIPLGPLLCFHDGTVSALRAYSKEQIGEILVQVLLESNLPKDAYQIEVFSSASYAEWYFFGFPLLKLLPGMNDPAMQFLFIRPK